MLKGKKKSNNKNFNISRKKIIQKRLFQIFFIVLVVFIIFQFIGIGRIQSDSMEPAYHDGDFIIYSKWDDEYKPGDVIVIDYEGRIIIRRVVGVNGDTIEINNESGYLYINGRKDEYGEGMTLSDPEGIKFPVEVKERQVFVLSDQRSHMMDSRRMGAINYKSILGKVVISF